LRARRETVFFDRVDAPRTRAIEHDQQSSGGYREIVEKLDRLVGCLAAGIAQKSWARNAAGTMNTTNNAAPNLARIPSSTESPPISRNAMLPSNKNEDRGMPSPAISSSAADQLSCSRWAHDGYGETCRCFEPS